MFAPKCIIDGMNIQDYLQSHYIEACGQLADRLREYDDGSLYDGCIIGWDSMNEPFEGFVGREDLNVNPTKQGSTVKKGMYPTPAQSFRLGMGQSQTVEHWTFGAMGPSKDGMVTIDPKGLKMWADPGKEGDEEQQVGGPQDFIEAVEASVPPNRAVERTDGTHARWGWKRDVSSWPLGTCLWALHGVWDLETGFVLRPDYFRFDPSTGVEVEFMQDFWKPHFLAYKKRIGQAHPEGIWFVQPPVFAFPPEMEKEELKGRCAYSCHYYDGLTLLTRHWNWFNADALGMLRGKYGSTLPAVRIGEGAIRKCLQEQLAMLKSDAEILGDYPTVIGEIGTPFDMDNKKSYGWTDGGKHKGNYDSQQKALDASLNACDGVNALNYTTWTFCPDDHSHEWGDGWNLEDLSLWSPADVWERDRREGRAKRWGLQKGQVNAGSTANLRKRIVSGSSEEQVGQNEEAGSEGGAIGSGKTGPLQAESRVSLVNPPEAAVGKGQLRPSLAMMAAASSLSLATLGAASATLADGDEFDDDDEGRRLALLGWHSNPFDFLSDGARAVKAFNRPYPQKVVGVPTGFDFDIGKTTFKLTIEVGPEDEPRPEGLGRRRRIRRKARGAAKPTKSQSDGESDIEDADGAGEEGEEEDEPLATEIFLPLIHYAHPRLLDSPSRRRWVRGQMRERGGGSLESLSGSSTNSSFVESPRLPSAVPKVGRSAVESEGSTPNLGGSETPSIPQNAMNSTATLLGGPNTANAKNVDGKAPATPESDDDGAAGRAAGARKQEDQVHDVDKNVLPVVGAVPLVAPSTGRLGAAPIRPMMVKRGHSTGSVATLDTLMRVTKAGLLGGGGIGRPHAVVPGVVDDGEPLVDVEVKVSEGRWRVEGQKLLWWYDCPAEAAEGQGDGQEAEEGVEEGGVEGLKKGGVGKGRKVVTIEVRRKGGAVKAKEVRARKETWRDALCPTDACGVM